MIHSLKEEIRIILSLILYGVYLISSYEIIIQFEKEYKFKKTIYYLLEFSFGIFQIIITYYFSYNLANGYIPGYFIIFVLTGIYIYLKLIQDDFIKLIEKYLKILHKISPKIKKIFQEIFYSQELLIYFKKNLKRYQKIFRKKQKENQDEKLS